MTPSRRKMRDIMVVFAMSFAALTLILAGQALAVDAPAITGGKIESASVTIGKPPGTPTVSVTYTAPGLLSYIYVYLLVPNGNSALNTLYFIATLPEPASGTVTFENTYQPLLLSSPPGTWTIGGAAIGDRAGNSTYYTAAQAAALFSPSAFTVINKGRYGTTPPVVSAGALNATTFSLSKPAFVQATLTQKDPIGAISGNVFLTEPDGTVYSNASINLGTYGPYPVTSGKFSFGEDLNYPGAPPVPTGTWTITGYAVCDISSNCTTDTNSADLLQLFGTTTITVTP